MFALIILILNISLNKCMFKNAFENRPLHKIGAFASWEELIEISNTIKFLYQKSKFQSNHVSISNSYENNVSEILYLDFLIVMASFNI